MSDKPGKKFIKQLDAGRIQAGVLRVFLEDGRWAAAVDSIDDHLALMGRQRKLLLEMRDELTLMALE